MPIDPTRPIRDHSAGVVHTLLAFGISAGDISPVMTANASKVSVGGQRVAYSEVARTATFNVTTAATTAQSTTRNHGGSTCSPISVLLPVNITRGTAAKAIPKDNTS